MIIFDDFTIGRAVAKMANTVYNGDADHCIARVERDTLLGGCIYKDFTGASITVHVGSFEPNWANRDLLWVMSAYPFLQLGCKKVFAPVPAWNEDSIKFTKHFGFREETRIKDVYPEADGDSIVFAIRAEECRWLKHTPSPKLEVSYGWR